MRTLLLSLTILAALSAAAVVWVSTATPALACESCG